MFNREEIDEIVNKNIPKSYKYFVTVSNDGTEFDAVNQYWRIVGEEDDSKLGRIRIICFAAFTGNEEDDIFLSDASGANLNRTIRAAVAAAKSEMMNIMELMVD